jgi:carbon-monoxide dehydrogenase medium subunit
MLARPGLPEFDYIKAESTSQVFDLLKASGDDVKLFMGGTDLFIQMRDHSSGPTILLDIKGLPGMQEISSSKDSFSVGAAVSLNQLITHPDLRKNYPILCQAADTVGNYQLRNRATLGGNLCNASPSADLAPAALVYDAQIVLESPQGERTLDLDQFWLGPGSTALESDELLTAIKLPPPPQNAQGCYLKLGRSKMGDLAVVGVAVLGYQDPDSIAGIRFRIGINSTAPTPYRIPEVEQKLANEELTTELLQKAADAAMDISAPIEDVRATAAYQKKMVRNLTYQGLEQVWNILKK